MNDDGDPSVKISIHPLNTCNIGPQRPRETATTEQLSMLNAYKNNYDKYIIKYYKFVNSTLPRLIP